MRKIMIGCIAAALMMFASATVRADGGWYGGYGGHRSYYGGHGHGHGHVGHGHHHHQHHHHHGHYYSGYRGGYYGGYHGYRPYYGNDCYRGRSGFSLYLGF